MTDPVEHVPGQLDLTGRPVPRATALRPVTWTAEGGHTVVVELGPGGWYWRAVSANGTRLAREDTPGHTRKDAAVRAARRIHPPRVTA